MKKRIISAAFCLVCIAAVLLLLIAGCSSSQKQPDEDKLKSYSEIMNERLVSFTDCAEELSASLEEIAGSSSAPSDSQIERMSDALDRMKKACACLAGQYAPAEYADAQRALDEAMEDYAAAFEKLDALIDFFRNYDAEFRKFKNPVEGSTEIEKKERALYAEFADSMKKASASFRSACKKFNIDS